MIRAAFARGGALVALAALAALGALSCGDVTSELITGATGGSAGSPGGASMGGTSSGASGAGGASTGGAGAGGSNAGSSSGGASGGSGGTPMCATSDDCSGSERNICRVSDGVCVECTNEAPCDPEENCSSIMGECARPCASDADCIEEDDAHCDTDIGGFCAECVDDIHCLTGEVCGNWECSEP